ncbi:DMT family transporter [Thiomicrorhabdus sp. ZW0627]|uniref:DMT family transporter n=1 Tax=Thiomicrorhabdus sp. ZW0627 TaxID=3039774 RepID=UPI002436E72A|nr:DMT family transporter [Thiomicrorhabdus sp. ZW0627]MDG6773671.1 DMT family transporter [Thiomicrorhabdus sp. ZW0627]
MNALPVVVLFGASILWGLTWLPLKYLNQLGFDGIPLTMFVYLLMFVLIVPFVWGQRRFVTSNWKALVGVALLGGGAQLAFNTALIYGDVIRVMVLFYLVPIWGVLGGRIFLREQVDNWRWLGVGLAIIGAFLIVGGFNAFITPPSWIDVLALMSGFLFAMNNVVFRASQNVPVRLKLTSMFLGASVLAGSVVAFQGEAVNMNQDWESWGVLFLYAAVWMMVANFGTQWAVTHMETGRSSIIVIMELVTAVVSASLILGETMASVEMVGGSLILLAAFIEARRAK